jgi:hypothetical protein
MTTLLPKIILIFVSFLTPCTAETNHEFLPSVERSIAIHAIVNSLFCFHYAPSVMHISYQLYLSGKRIAVINTKELGIFTHIS